MVLNGKSKNILILVTYIAMLNHCISYINYSELRKMPYFDNLMIEYICLRLDLQKSPFPLSMLNILIIVIETLTQDAVE